MEALTEDWQGFWEELLMTGKHLAHVMVKINPAGQLIFRIGFFTSAFPILPDLFRSLAPDFRSINPNTPLRRTP